MVLLYIKGVMELAFSLQVAAGALLYVTNKTLTVYTYNIPYEQ